MAKKLGFIAILSMCLLIVELASAQEGSPSQAVSPERETQTDSPLSPESDSSLSPASSPESDSSLSPASSPEADSLLPPGSSPEPESSEDSSPPSPESPAPSPSPSSLSPGPAPVPAPSDDDDSDDDSDDDPEQETEYFPSPAPSPAPEIGEPEDIKASEDGYELEDNNGMSGSKKAGIAIGTILGVGAIVMGALVYKKRRENLTRARYTYVNEGDFL